jgi:hypothetical protein
VAADAAAVMLMLVDVNNLSIPRITKIIARPRPFVGGQEILILWETNIGYDLPSGINIGIRGYTAGPGVSCMQSRGGGRILGGLLVAVCGSAVSYYVQGEWVRHRAGRGSPLLAW